MRFRWLSIVSAVCLVLALPLQVAAGPNVAVFHGALTDATLTCDGVTTHVPTWGNWTATISPGMAQIDGNEFHDWGEGAMHQVAFGGVKWGRWEVVSAAPGSFHLSVLAYGGPTVVDAYLDGGKIQFHLAPYGTCEAADVYGVLR